MRKSPRSYIGVVSASGSDEKSGHYDTYAVLYAILYAVLYDMHEEKKNEIIMYC